MSRLQAIEAELAILKPKVIALEAEAKAIRDAEAAAVEAARRLVEEERYKKASEARLAAWYATQDGKAYKKNEEMYAARRQKLEDANTLGNSLADKLLLHEDDMLIVSTIVSALKEGEFYAFKREDVKSKLTLAFQKKRYNYLYGSIKGKFQEMMAERGFEESYGDFAEYQTEFDYAEYIPIENVSEGVIEWCIERHGGGYLGDTYASSYAHHSTIDWDDEITVLEAIIKAGKSKSDKLVKVYEEYVAPPYGARIDTQTIKGLIECPWEFPLDGEDEYEDVEDSSSESGSEGSTDYDDDKPFTFTLYVKFSFPKQEAPKPPKPVASAPPSSPGRVLALGKMGGAEFQGISKAVLISHQDAVATLNFWKGTVKMESGMKAGQPSGSRSPTLIVYSDTPYKEAIKKLEEEEGYVKVWKRGNNTYFEGNHKKTEKSNPNVMFQTVEAAPVASAPVAAAPNAALATLLSQARAAPVSSLSALQDKFLLRPEQFVVGAEFSASNKQIYVVSDKAHIFPKKIGDVFYMKKKNGKNNIRFEVDWDFFVNQSEKSDYVFTEANYKDELATSQGREKFAKPDGSIMTFAEAKAKYGSTHKAGQAFSLRQEKHISLGKLKDTTKDAAAPAPAPAAKKVEAPISVPKKEFVAEHKELVQVLKKDEPKAVAKEAKKQESELKKVVSSPAPAAKKSPPPTLSKPIEKYTKQEIAEIFREHFKKLGKSVGGVRNGKPLSLSQLNKHELIALYKEMFA
jgi:hypothetical protein